VLSFAYDLDEYENEERGLFYDLEHVFPGAVCRDFGQLATALEQAIPGAAADPRREWRTRFFFDHVDDRSAGRVVDRVKALYVDTGAALNAREEAA
jgi:CDP-glycerol glycerophosphotransferase (TagB/SpsB family)